MAVTLKFQSTGSIPGNGDTINMRGASLTIGRGNENDLVLPDPNRELSKRHCAIEDHNGNVIVVDFSTNGTFLNYGKLALGATPTPLNDGDILSVGPYEILVSIASQADQDMIAAPVADEQVSHGSAAGAPSDFDLMNAPGDGGDFLDDLLGGRDAAPLGPRGVDRDEPGDDGLLPPLGDEDDLLRPHEDPYAGQGASISAHNAASQDNFSASRPFSGGGSAIPDDWEDDFLAPTPPAPSGPATGGESTPFAVPSGAARIPDELTLQPLQPAPVAPVPTDPAARPTKKVTDVDPARSFLAALGADDIGVPDDDLPATMVRMGKVLRVMIEGMREILMTRTSFKSEFRIERTMIQMGGNNPLKFSISPEQAIEAMVRPKTQGYLDAIDASEEALKDIKAHEVAVITGMEAALKGILKKLDPAVLEAKINKENNLSGMLKSRKARYWEIYETMYSEISDQAENDFQELFAKEFARAYQDQLDKLK